MAENDLGDNNRILASISNGTGTSGMLAAVVSNIGGSIKSHPSAMTSDPQGASVNTQPQVQVLSHAPPPPTQQHQQQPQQTLSHHSHSSLSSQPSTASVGDGGGVGAGSSGGEGGASHVSEGVIVNTDDVPKAQHGNFGIGLATPTSQLLQHQQQQQQQQQHQLFLLQHQQQQQQQQQQQEHQRQFNELQEQEQRRLLQESIQPMPPVEPRRELTQSDEILIPSQEQEYESLEAAQHAAERYARSVNTVVIVKRTTKDKHGNVVQKDLACERQGSYIGTAKKTPEAYNIRTKRCGCPWMISVGFSKKRGNRDGKRGRFTKLSLEHNHPLQPLPEDAPAGPSKLTLKDLRSGQTSVPKPEISASASSRTQTSRARSSASKSAAAAAQALSGESSGPVKTNAAKGRGKDHDKENNESKGEVAASLDESRQLSNYNMTTFLPQAAILSSDRVSTVPSVSLPAGLQPSSNALGPLSSDVMSALGANAHDIHRPLQGIGRTDITWDDLKTQMSHIPWDLQSDAMKALMDVLQLTLQTYQVPTIGTNRHADAEASAAATAAAIADVVGSLPANYNPGTSHTQEQPHSHQPIQQPQAQAPPPPPPSSFARHHNLSSSRAGPSAMEGISHNLAGTTSTSELLQLHRADTGELNGGRERGHRRQGSSASGPIQGSGSDGATAMMTSQTPSTQVSTAIPSVVSSLPPSANPTAPSTPSALSTTASPLLTAVPTLRNVIHGHMAPSVEPLQGSFLQHSRQSSHSGAGHHRTQSGSLANVNQGIHALDSNGTLLGHNHSQSNGTSNNSSMDSSPLISQTQTLLDAAARVHNNQSEAQRQAEEQAQIQAQVNADTEAAVNAALNMNSLQGPTASSSALSGSGNSGHVGSTVSVSNANAASSPIPLNLLDAVSMNTLPNFTQQLLQQQQRLQQLQQQQQHQQHQQQHQQQQPQPPVHTHPSDVEKDGGSDLALSEPPRKRVKQEALYAPEQQ